MTSEKGDEIIIIGSDWLEVPQERTKGLTCGLEMCFDPILIKSDCWIKSVLTSKICIAFYSTDQDKVSIIGIDNCRYVRVTVHVFI